MIRGVTWGVNTFDGPSISCDSITVYDGLIWHKIHIAAFFNRFALRNLTCAMRTKAVGFRLPSLFERGRCRRVIHMGMSDQDVGYRFASQCLGQCFDVLINEWARINNRYIAMPDDIGASPVEGKS